MDILWIFFKVKVCCVFLLESPHRGDSNEYTQYTIFNTKKEQRHTLSQICSYGILFGLKKDIETAVVNEPSVGEPLKFYCILSTLVISKSKGPAETLRDIRTSTYQMCRIEENTNRTNKFFISTCHLTPSARNIY